MKNNLLIGILFVTTFAFSQKVDIKIKPNAAINPTALQIFAIPENLGGAEITNIVVTVTTSNVCRAFLDNPTTTVSGVTVGANGPFPSGSDNPNNTIYVLTGGWSSYTPNVDNLVMTIPINSPSGTCSFTGIKNYVFSVNDGNFYVESGGQGVERNIINEADNIILPVTLTSFDANKIGRTTELTWKTSSERNSSHFILERSNGGDFTKIGTVKAANLPTGKDYFFIDENPLSGKNTYRLRMIDLDGKTEFSKMQILTFAGIKKTAVYPNPSESDVTVEVSSEKGIGEVTFEVVNLTGSLIYTRKVAAQDEFMTTTLPTKALPAGTYFIKILNGSNVWQHKFIKQ